MLEKDSDLMRSTVYFLWGDIHNTFRIASTTVTLDQETIESGPNAIVEECYKLVLDDLINNNKISVVKHVTIISKEEYDYYYKYKSE